MRRHRTSKKEATTHVDLHDKLGGLYPPLNNVPAGGGGAGCNT
jgi:hypothetical protein